VWGAAAVAVLTFVPLSVAHAATYQVLHKFLGSWENGNTDGGFPTATLTLVGGKLYGTTNQGGIPDICHSGDHGCGTVFEFDPATGHYETIYRFKANGTDGNTPQYAMIEIGGLLYGTTAFGGQFDKGTIFSLDPKTGKEKVVHHFSGGTDGDWPHSDLLDVDGTIYGATLRGGGLGNCTAGQSGNVGCGTVFKINPTNGGEKILHAFQGDTDGAEPGAGLIQIGKALYGTTFAGGGYGNCTNGDGVDLYCGTLYKITLRGKERVIYSFCSQATCTDGAEPDIDLINVKGMLYGTTYEGGKDQSCGPGLGCGTAFKIDHRTGAEQIVYNFTSSHNNGFIPVGMMKVKGTFWGVTEYGGGGCGTTCGTIFELDPKTGDEQVVHAFTGPDGIRPVGGLINVGGTFYGTTTEDSGGGSEDEGVLFSFKP
jgi:uncharacterized repeat protein (TIGR03803 family)